MSMLKYNSTSSDEFFKVNIVIKNIYKGIDINATIDVKEDLMEIGVNLIWIIEKLKIKKKKFSGSSSNSLTESNR